MLFRSDTWVLSCQKKASGENAFTATFKLRANGSAEFISDSTAMVSVIKESDPDFHSTLSYLGLFAQNTDNGFEANYYGGGITIRDTASGNIRVYLSPLGLFFYDANGNATKSYLAT